MLNSFDAVANVAVKDLQRAREFYQSVLGLTPVDEQDGELIVYKSGDTVLNVYRSQYAGTNQATAVTWNVGRELTSIIKTLRGKGVKFEHYELPNARLDGDVHVIGNVRVAWFKDPDGNILNLFHRQ